MLMTIKQSRILIAFLVAPLSILLLPAIISILAIVWPDLLGIEFGDDAPTRAAVLILAVLVPVGYLVVGVIIGFVVFTLSELGQLTLKNLFLVSGMMSIGVGLFFGLPSPFGLKDQLLGFLNFTVIAILCFSFGVLTWWRIASIGHKRSLR